MGKQVTNGQSIVSTEVTIREFSSGRLKKDTIYTDDTRIKKVVETIHTYVGTKLTKSEKNTYDIDGTTIVLTETINYFEDAIAGGNKAIEKRS